MFTRHSAIALASMSLFLGATPPANPQATPDIFAQATDSCTILANQIKTLHQDSSAVLTKGAERLTAQQEAESAVLNRVCDNYKTFIALLEADCANQKLLLSRNIANLGLAKHDLDQRKQALEDAHKPLLERIAKNQEMIKEIQQKVAMLSMQAEVAKRAVNQSAADIQQQQQKLATDVDQKIHAAIEKLIAQLLIENKIKIKGSVKDLVKKYKPAKPAQPKRSWLSSFSRATQSAPTSTTADTQQSSKQPSNLSSHNDTPQALVESSVDLDINT